MTQISINNVAPVFLEKEKIERSEIWNKQIVFNKGEKVQLVAPSGSGKTSFVHFLYGMRKDYTGNITINGKDIKQSNPEEIANLRSSHISIVFQDLRLFTDHSAMENISIKRELKAQGENNIEQMAERLGIASKLKQQAGICSYGERQRIAIIRALQQPFDFIVLDEPFSHLDEANSKKALALIEEEADKRGAGIILADLEPVSFYKAERTIHL
ncbi:MAG: ATP-binding cassette domain-containing protein [Sphingobacteriales bacterium]|nr:MAG: ATP-binding cassette domain-containing protein [Sphingobacteriales bacterium]